jgi:hypothetical protein
MARVIPEEIVQKHMHWQQRSARWNWANTLLGLGAVLLTTLIAANAGPQFLPTYAVIGVSMIAGALAFLVTALNADLKAKGFGLAARELEAAIARYRFDDTLPERYLAEAEVRGLTILNMFDSKKSSSG